MLVIICTYASNWRHVGKFLGLIVEWYTPHNQLHTDTQKIINSKIMLLYRFGICLSAAATTNTSINNGYLVFVSLKLKLCCYYLSILDSGRRVIYYLFSHGIILPKITSFFLGGYLFCYHKTIHSGITFTFGGRGWQSGIFVHNIYISKKAKNMQRKSIFFVVYKTCRLSSQKHQLN